MNIDKEIEHLKNMRRVFEYISDGEVEAANILIYIKSTYAEWEKMILWIKKNDLRGKKLIDFFKNESDESGGGYLLGCTLILSRIKGHKNNLVGVKIYDLTK